MKQTKIEQNKQRNGRKNTGNSSRCRYSYVRTCKNSRKTQNEKNTLTPKKSILFFNYGYVGVFVWGSMDVRTGACGGQERVSVPWG